MEKFVEAGTKKHSGKYKYSGEYINTDVKVPIECPTHGVFWQTPHNHLNGSGCMKCANEERSVAYRKDQELFIDQVVKVHDGKYGYTNTIYVNNKTNIQIDCPEHGAFWQKALHHLNGSGCPKCNNNGIFSKVELLWLNHLGIPNTPKYRFIRLEIGGKIIKPDAYDPDTNTIYEFYGDYWHGNPKKFASNDMNLISSKTFGVLFQETMVREDLLRSAGYNLVSIWESDWKTIAKTITNEQDLAQKNFRPS